MKMCFLSNLRFFSITHFCLSFTQQIRILTFQIDSIILLFKMQQLLAKLDSLNSWKDQLKRVARKNKVSVGIACYYSPLKISSFLVFLTKKNSQQNQTKKKFWIENQLRAFHWILLALSLVTNKNIADFQIFEWESVGVLFPGKSIDIIQYESIRLVNQKKTQNINWKPAQNQLLKLIINQSNQKESKSYKWNQIARQLFEKSKGQFFRTGKQCRQKWLNHLDPSKKHGQWTQFDDYTIAKTIVLIGKKWSEIARSLKQRTQHMVKNRYKSLILKFKKCQGKKLNENQILRKIIQNYQGEEISIQNHKDFFIKTRNNLREPSKYSKKSIEQNEKIQILNSQQMRDQANDQGIKYPQLSNQIYGNNSKQIQRQKGDYKSCHTLDIFENKILQIQEIEDPLLQDNTVKTPILYEFSPNVQSYLSFGHYQSCFFI